MFIFKTIEDILSLMGLGSMTALGIAGCILVWAVDIVAGIILLIIALAVLYAMYYWPREFIYRVLLRKTPPPEKLMKWIERVDAKVDAYIEKMNNGT